MKAFRTLGLEVYDGNAVGRDPRTLSVDELHQLGHARRSPLKALRRLAASIAATRSAAFSEKEQTSAEGWDAPTPTPDAAGEFPRQEKGANR